MPPSPSQEHRPAWTRFNKTARKAPGAVGIWHETFLVERAESIYVSTVPMGLPQATELVPITGIRPGHGAHGRRPHRGDGTRGVAAAHGTASPTG